MNDKQREKEKRETPIEDGDTRPDMPADPKEKKAGKPEGADPENKFESERSSDLNSLEDYKDAK